MRRSAFTLLELIFVITIIAVLTATAMFYFRSGDNELIQATNQLARHIRYTQHLALMDDRFDPGKNDWYVSRWQIQISNSAQYRSFYTVFSNLDNQDGYENREVARDPFSKRIMTGDLSRAFGDEYYNLTASYNVEFLRNNCRTGGGFPVRIPFDNLGRPYYLNNDYTSANFPNAYQGLLTTPCTITLRHLSSGETSYITIHPETGFVEISY